MTEAMPFLQKYDITFLRPPAIRPGFFACRNKKIMHKMHTKHLLFAFFVLCFGCIV